MRKTYLDNIRWITVVLVVIYHVIYMYNGIEVFGVIGPFADIQYQDGFQYLVYPWFMLLLFVVSGICSGLYLEKHSDKDFLKSRTVKLLVPSTIGLFVFQWILGYYNMAISGADSILLEPIPGVVKYMILSVSGTGVLWYIQLLWVFSVVLVLIRKFEKNRFYDFCKKTNVAVLLLLCLAVWGGAQILNTPVVTVYRFGIYGVGFFIGYFCMSHDEVVERLEKYSAVLGIVAVILGISFLAVYWQQPYAESVVLKTPLCNVFAWITVLAVLSFMHKKGNFENALSRFMNRKSWGLYLFHYLPLSMCAYYLRRYVPDTVPVVCYLLAAIAAFGGAFLLDGVIRRIPWIRWCVMGISKKRK